MNQTSDRAGIPEPFKRLPWRFTSHFVLFADDAKDGESYGWLRDAYNRVNAPVFILPTGNGRPNIHVVEHATSKPLDLEGGIARDDVIFDSHASGSHRTKTINVRVGTWHIGEDPNSDSSVSGWPGMGTSAAAPAPVMRRASIRRLIPDCIVISPFDFFSVMLAEDGAPTHWYLGGRQ